VVWEDEERINSWTFYSGWGLELANSIASDQELWEASMKNKLDIRGTLTGNFENQKFIPDPNHDGHTRKIIVKSIMEG
jgi:hypothetical protein